VLEVLTPIRRHENSRFESTSLGDEGDGDVIRLYEIA